MSTSTLAALQNSLQGYILNQHNNVDNLTIETLNFSKQQRLNIYHSAYQLRLIEALRNDYPALPLMLGEAIFSQLMTEYIAENPSQHPSLRWFGKKLPEFLRTHPIWQDQIVIVELAAFEWAQIMVFDAAHALPATLDDLRKLTNTQWLTLQLTFQPALNIIDCSTNAPSVWNALIKDGTQIDTTAEDKIQPWLIWRTDLRVVYRPLDDIESWCLQAFLRNENFASVCEGLSEFLPAEQVPLKTVQFLQQWLQNELIQSINTAP